MSFLLRVRLAAKEAVDLLLPGGSVHLRNRGHAGLDRLLGDRFGRLRRSASGRRKANDRLRSRQVHLRTLGVAMVGRVIGTLRWRARFVVVVVVVDHVRIHLPGDGLGLGRLDRSLEVLREEARFAGGVGHNRGGGGWNVERLRPLGDDFSIHAFDDPNHLAAEPGRFIDDHLTPGVPEWRDNLVVRLLVNAGGRLSSLSSALSNRLSDGLLVSALNLRREVRPGEEGMVVGRVGRRHRRRNV